MYILHSNVDFRNKLKGSEDILKMEYHRSWDCDSFSLSGDRRWIDASIFFKSQNIENLERSLSFMMEYQPVFVDFRTFNGSVSLSTAFVPVSFSSVSCKSSHDVHELCRDFVNRLTVAYVSSY